MGLHSFLPTCLKWLGVRPVIYAYFILHFLLKLALFCTSVRLNGILLKELIVNIAYKGQFQPLAGFG
jgi:hypothetical protein